MQDLWGLSLSTIVYGNSLNERAAAPLTTRDLWPRHHGSMPMGDGWAHQVAATLWPESYMALLTGLPSLFQIGVRLSRWSRSTSTGLQP